MTKQLGLVLTVVLSPCSFLPANETGTCKTVSGSKPNQPCQFPWRWGNSPEFSSCMFTPSYGHYWCSTLTENGVHVPGHWGICDMTSSSCLEPLEEVLREGFQEMDVDGNGFLSADELRRAGYPDELIDETLMKWDIDEDSQLNLKEYLDH